MVTTSTPMRRASLRFPRGTARAQSACPRTFRDLLHRFVDRLHTWLGDEAGADEDHGQRQHRDAFAEVMPSDTVETCRVPVNSRK